MSAQSKGRLLGRQPTTLRRWRRLATVTYGTTDPPPNQDTLLSRRHPTSIRAWYGSRAELYSPPSNTARPTRVLSSSRRSSSPGTEASHGVCGCPEPSETRADQEDAPRVYDEPISNSWSR